MVGGIALGLLAGCGTPEYRAQKDTCEAEWYQKIPPNLTQRLVTLYRTEQRPTGQINCSTFGAYTNCNQVMRTVSIPYQSLQTVDLNKGQRDVQVDACTQQACLAKYGNAECKSS